MVTCRTIFPIRRDHEEHSVAAGEKALCVGAKCRPTVRPSTLPVAAGRSASTCTGPRVHALTGAAPRTPIMSPKAAAATLNPLLLLPPCAALRTPDDPPDKTRPEIRGLTAFRCPTFPTKPSCSILCSHSSPAGGCGTRGAAVSPVHVAPSYIIPELPLAAAAAA
jgi:hypothetical protein